MEEEGTGRGMVARDGGWFDVSGASLLGSVNKPASLLLLLKHQNRIKAAGSMEPLGSDAVVCVQRV